MKSLLLFTILFMMYPGKRQVLIFYNNEGAALQKEQIMLLQQQQKQVQERDIEIHVYQLSGAPAEMKKWKVPPSTKYQFILVGKDGGEKLRIDSVIDTKQLFAVIDAMPMRKEEMKHE